MPIIKSAKKRMRQNLKRKMRNYPVRSEMKTLFKNELKLIKDGNVEEAKKVLAKAYSIIDMACKKKILHPNTAARKKSRLARALNELESRGGVAKEPVAKAKKKVEKAEKVEEVVEKTEA